MRTANCWCGRMQQYRTNWLPHAADADDGRRIRDTSGVFLLRSYSIPGFRLSVTTHCICNTTYVHGVRTYRARKHASNGAQSIVHKLNIQCATQTNDTNPKCLHKLTKKTLLPYCYDFLFTSKHSGRRSVPKKHCSPAFTCARLCVRQSHAALLYTSSTSHILHTYFVHATIQYTWCADYAESGE